MRRPLSSPGPLSALSDLYDRRAARGEAPAFGFAPAPIAFVLVLSPGGQLAAVQDVRSREHGRARPLIIEAPQPPKRTMAVVSGLLWDKTSYVLGVTRLDLEPDEARRARSADRAAREHEAFKQRQRSLLEGCEDVGARALLAFLQGWSAQAYWDLAFAESMLDRNVAFQLEGDLGLLHDRPALRARVAHQADAEGAAIGQCLVTGEMRPIARLHPWIKGVHGAPSSGASLVSFQAPSYISRGKVQGENAPTSELAAFAYGTALNALLSAVDGQGPGGRPRYRHRAQIGDAATVFWSEVEGELGAEAEGVLSLLFNGTTAGAGGEAEAAPMSVARAVMAALEVGRPLADVAPRLEAAPVFVLGLSPNAGRLSVRSWHTGTLGALTGGFQAHWADLRLEPSPTPRPASLGRLLRLLAGRGEAGAIPPILAGGLLRAVMTGDRYPRDLLAALLMRMRTDQAEGKLDDQRVALVKAIIARDFRKGMIEAEPPVALDPGQTDLGYRLGRVFAVLEAAQAAVRGGVGGAIRDRWAIASASPARVFPLLRLQGRRDLSRLRATRPGLARTYEGALGEIGLALEAVLPVSLDVAGQGRFALGYYHQRRATYAKRLDGAAAAGDGLSGALDETEAS